MMGKIDKIKEDVGAIKTYLGFIIALIISVGAGISKLYIDGTINILFYVGSAVMILLVLIFAIMSKKMHKKINELEGL